MAVSTMIAPKKGFTGAGLDDTEERLSEEVETGEGWTEDAGEGEAAGLGETTAGDDGACGDEAAGLLGASDGLARIEEKKGEEAAGEDTARLLGAAEGDGEGRREEGLETATDALEDGKALEGRALEGKSEDGLGSAEGDG